MLALTAILHEQGIPVVWAYRDDPVIVPTWATGVRAGALRFDVVSILGGQLEVIPAAF